MKQFINVAHCIQLSRPSWADNLPFSAGCRPSPDPKGVSEEQVRAFRVATIYGSSKGRIITTPFVTSVFTSSPNDTPDPKWRELIQYFFDFKANPDSLRTPLSEIRFPEIRIRSLIEDTDRCFDLSPYFNYDFVDLLKVFKDHESYNTFYESLRLFGRIAATAYPSDDDLSSFYDKEEEIMQVVYDMLYIVFPSRLIKKKIVKPSELFSFDIHLEGDKPKLSITLFLYNLLDEEFIYE